MTGLFADENCLGWLFLVNVYLLIEEILYFLSRILHLHILAHILLFHLLLFQFFLYLLTLG